MARIRIVDEWLRSPVSGPSYRRAVMVVADSWSEQRVLMRAFAGASDQTRPTIVLHGAELAISPAGVDAHGAWGIHVEPPADGRAQELRAQLELAARRLAGAKGNPPRLVDEQSRFDGKPTGQWAPGTPPDVPVGARTRFGHGYYEPAELAPPGPVPAWASAGAPPAVALASPQPELMVDATRSQALDAGRVTVMAGSGMFGGERATPNPGFRGADGERRTRPTQPPGFDGSRTQPGFAPPPTSPPSGPWTVPPPALFDGGAALAQPMEAPPLAAPSLSRLVGHTMPLGFRLSDAERSVLNELGRHSQLGAAQIATIAGVADGVAWMEALMLKLAEHGLDLVGPGPARGAEPTYALRR